MGLLTPSHGSYSSSTFVLVRFTMVSNKAYTVFKSVPTLHDLFTVRNT